MVNEMSIRIGIIGTGRIARRFVDASKQVETACVCAIFNPHIDSAQSFAQQMRMNCMHVLVTDNLSEFFNAVDAVYIASPHETHYLYAKQALMEDRHVLCEKPMSLTKAESSELFAIANQKKRILMEAVKTAYCPGFLGILSLIQGGAIGQVHDVEACFTKLGSASLREIWGMTGGSFTELGSYVLLPIVKLFGIQNSGRMQWSLPCITGTDSYSKVIYTYQNGCATAKTGLGVKSEGELIIAGEKGYIQVPSPWWTTRHVEVHHENPSQIECYDFPYEGSGLQYELTAFVRRIHGEYDEALGGLTKTESIWMAEQMETFIRERKDLCISFGDILKQQVNIWAHRGCSMRYPENTLLAFKKAAQIHGITGIELDVQFTKDGALVVIHDEQLERTTTGHGKVVEHTLAEVKSFAITPSGAEKAYMDETGDILHVPTLREVFDLLKPYCVKNGLKINIELKNSVEAYEGIEDAVMSLVNEYELDSFIIYSSFNHASIGYIKNVNPLAKTGILSSDMIDCLEEAKKYGADALHPSIYGMAINEETLCDVKSRKLPVRMWTGEEPLYGQTKILKEADYTKYAILGMTDLITNVPERYLKENN